jgi:hypothetical protein
MLSSYSFIQWHYICKKCGKTSVIQQMALNDFLETVTMKVKKEEALGMDNSQYKNVRFIVGSYILEGKTAYYAQQRLKNYKQEKVIPRYS